jgi:hypothetical protein
MQVSRAQAPHSKQRHYRRLRAHLDGPIVGFGCIPCRYWCRRLEVPLPGRSGPTHCARVVSSSLMSKGLET